MVEPAKRSPQSIKEGVHQIEEMITTENIHHESVLTVEIAKYESVLRIENHRHEYRMAELNAILDKLKSL